jgi:hypothetical protein
MQHDDPLNIGRCADHRDLQSNWQYHRNWYFYRFPLFVYRINYYATPTWRFAGLNPQKNTVGLATNGRSSNANWLSFPNNRL